MRYWLWLFTILIFLLPFPTEAHPPQQSAAPFKEIFQVGRGTIYHVEWHPSAPLILVDTASGAWLYDDQLHDVAFLPDVRLARFSPDGRYIAGHNDQYEVLIYDALTQTLIATLQRHKASIITLAWSASTRFIATSDRDGQLIVWNVDSQKPQWIESGIRIDGLSWNLSQDYLLTRNILGKFIIWDIASGKVLHEIQVERPARVLGWYDAQTAYFTYVPDITITTVFWSMTTGEQMDLPYSISGYRVQPELSFYKIIKLHDCAR